MVVFWLFLCFVFVIFYHGFTSGEVLDRSWFAKTLFFNMTSLGCLGFILIGYRLGMGALAKYVARFVANVSYGAYLCNLFVLSLVDKYVDAPPFLKWFVFIFSVFAVSWLVFTFWESKFMTYRNGRFKDA